MAFDEATRRQIAAADPLASTWLSANAGSGKTRVLTDRVARLLLQGVSPQNILCLTYTKAAATEMQNRLFKRLGAWSMRSDKDLRDDLAKLGVSDVADAAQLAQARTLFARAIETPGGLRIQTIHSFCASLLRRFPLEAGVSPVFREFDDRSAKLLRQDVIEEMADGPQAAQVLNVARFYSGDDFGKLTAEIVRLRKTLPPSADRDAVWQEFGLAPNFTDDDLLASVFLPGDMEKLADLIKVLKTGSTTDVKAVNTLGQIDLNAPSPKGLETCISTFLTGAKTKAPFSAKIDTFPTKALRQDHPDLIDWLNPLMARVESAREVRNRLYSAKKTLAMYEFASVFLPEYEARKARAGWLDFDDLIARAGQLLTDPEVAQWVLFRLDGGLDHILVDEAQDTSPEQWRIVELLAQEFSTGIGAREDVLRTIFVVGDIKQSIYSFQGADPRSFDQMRHHFSGQLSNTGQVLHERSLDHSFRSSSAVLSVVDSVFRDTNGPGFASSHHLAFHEGLAGRVDLWPLVQTDKDSEEREWYDPTDKLAANDHRIILANAIAEEIQNLQETGTIPGENGDFRHIEYGDFLILFQRRSQLFHEVIRACKARNLPIAGADRLKIGAELAVKDLTALLSFLATPDDSLSLAAVLRSPLVGLTESQLFDLAHDRSETLLWSALLRRKSDFPEAHDMLYRLRNQADFMAPYELLEQVLIRHRGRTQLLARLGIEAEDGIDAMLGQAIEFERVETPSLTGFLTWLEVDEVEIKRQSDSAGNRIRVMTTHGAKGLESAIVILPDTGDRTIQNSGELVQLDADRTVWKPTGDLQDDATKQALAKEKAAQEEERLRLLYVALTRAEKWLIVCASGNAKIGGDSWYRKVETGMQELGACDLGHVLGPGLRWQAGEWHDAKDRGQTHVQATPPSLPDWAMRPAPPAADMPKSMAPSDLGGAKALPGDDTPIDPESGARRGRMLHQLFEHLPNHAVDDWPDLANKLLSVGEDIADDAEIADILAEATAVLNAPDLANLFGPGALAEVDLSANLPELDGHRIAGAIDRMIFQDGRVLIVDFKSNRVVPSDATQTPEGILRQMGAYLSAVEQIYPNHNVDVAVLWTRTASLMVLGHDIVREALRRTATS